MKKIITALAVIVCSNFVLAQAPGCPSIDAGPNDTIDCYSSPCVELFLLFIKQVKQLLMQLILLPMHRLFHLQVEPLFL